MNSTQSISRGGMSWCTALLALLGGACKAAQSSDASSPAPATSTQALLAQHQPTLDIPYASPTLSDTIEKTFSNLQVTPKNDAALAYQLGVPAQWAPSKQSAPALEEPVGDERLGIFAGSAEPGSPTISVTVSRVPFEIPVDA